MQYEYQFKIMVIFFFFGKIVFYLLLTSFVAAVVVLLGASLIFLITFILKSPPAGLRHRSKRVRTPISLLCSLSD